MGVYQGSENYLRESNAKKPPKSPGNPSPSPISLFSNSRKFSFSGTSTFFTVPFSSTLPHQPHGGAQALSFEIKAMLQPDRGDRSPFCRRHQAMFRKRWGGKKKKNRKKVHVCVHRHSHTFSTLAHTTFKKKLSKSSAKVKAKPVT